VCKSAIRPDLAERTVVPIYEYRCRSCGSAVEETPQRNEWTDRGEIEPEPTVDHWLSRLTSHGHGEQSGQSVGWVPVVTIGVGWDSIDFTTGTLAVSRTLTYAGKELHLRDEAKSEAGHRTIDLPGFALEALRRHRVAQDVRRLKLGSAWRDIGLVIDKGDGGPWEPTRLSKMWRKWATSKGFGDVKVHGLRRGYATLGLAAGLRPEVMIEMMGHSSTRILKRYQDVIPSLKREAADQFDRLLGEAR
jgi:hypothetical protein